MPWTNDVVSPRELVDALAESLNATILEHDPPVWKPHWRVAYSIHLGKRDYVDISIAPRVDMRTGRVIDALPIPAATPGWHPDEVYKP